MARNLNWGLRYLITTVVLVACQANLLSIWICTFCLLLIELNWNQTCDISPFTGMLTLSKTSFSSYLHLLLKRRIVAHRASNHSYSLKNLILHHESNMDFDFVSGRSIWLQAICSRRSVRKEWLFGTVVFISRRFNFGKDRVNTFRNLKSFNYPFISTWFFRYICDLFL